MGDNEISLKEVLLEVSRKLDRFLEAHSQLHMDMAMHSSRVDSMLGHHEETASKVEELEDWKTEVQGQLKLLKWATSGGLVAAGAMILRLLGFPLP